MSVLHIFIRKLKTLARNPRLLITKSVYVFASPFMSILFSFKFFRAWRSELLATLYNPVGRNFADDLLFDIVFRHWTETVYLKGACPDKRAKLNMLCMGGGGGVAWADAYEASPIDRNAKFGHLTHDQLLPAFPALDNLLETASKETVVVQIGCSSGREIAYFAARFPDVSFIGTDIDAPIIERAQRVHLAPNLKFSFGMAHTLLDHLVVPRDASLVLWSSGSLQYVQPEHIVTMFDSLRNRGNVTLILNENSFYDDCEIDEIHGSRWRGSFSFSHDYKYYAENAGFKTVEFASIQPELNPKSMHYRTRHYYYCRV